MSVSNHRTEEEDGSDRRFISVARPEVSQKESSRRREGATLFFFEKWEGATLSPLLLIIPNVSANEGCGEHQGIASRGALRIIVAIRSSARIGPIWLPLVA